VGFQRFAAAGVIAMLRLLRWRLWLARERPDLWCLGVGYCWISVGLLLVAYTSFTGDGLSVALHALTVGALGTLTLNVMARIATMRAKRDPAHGWAPVTGTLLIALATFARLGAGFAAKSGDLLLLFSAGCWSAAFITLLGLFIRLRHQVAVTRDNTE
jgi:uncharacterized protein involved in response to NO